MQTLKLKDNLWVRGDKVISYETVVGKIVGDTLIELGKFSRTTSKHIHDVARRFGLSVKPAQTPKKESFYKFETGVKCEAPGALTVRTSQHIAQAMASGMNYLNAAASVPNLSKRDLNLIKEWLRKEKISVETFEQLQKWHKIKELV